MSGELLAFALQAFVTIFAIVDPIGNVPFFITATACMTHQERRVVAFRSCVVAGVVLAVFALLGLGFMWVFKISMPAVRIGGGIVLLVIALKILSGRQFDWEHDQPEVQPGRATRDAGVVPLGIPLMAGPGAMSSAIVLASQHSSQIHYLLTLLAVIVVVCAIGYVLYLAAIPLIHRIGRTAMVSLSCLMGLVLAALAVQFMLDGLHEFMPLVFNAK